MMNPQLSARKHSFSAGSGRPRKACNHCKAQKVRCSGDRPICKRCSRTNYTCIYANASSQAPNGPYSQANSPVANIPRPKTSLDPTPPSHPSRGDAALDVALADKYYLGVPLSLMPVLIQVFYSYAYNASLLLHREQFLKSVAEGTATPHVLLSVCAIASNFYRDAKGDLSLRDHDFGTEWAERASKLVLQDIENPTEDNLVTLLNLSLFWYSQGSWRRSHIHKGNAVQTAYILGLGNDKSGTDTSLRAETRRRRFWACYLISCHAAESVFMHEPSKSTQNLPLPWPEQDIEAGRLSHDVGCLVSGQSSNSMYGELIKAMTFWSEVYRLINSPEGNTKTSMAAIHTLDDRIRKWWTRIDPVFQLQPHNMHNTDTSILPKVILINIVYRQCLCALHSSIVPLFSWSAGDDSWATARQVSAQIAYDHACAASAVLESALTYLPDANSLPSFVAYAAYCGCAIQIPFLWSSEPRIQDLARKNVRTNVKTIRILAKIWKFSALLEIHVQYLYQQHAKNPVVLENEPKCLELKRLSFPCIPARLARASILGHNSILWASGSGYAQPGEEVQDLGNGAEEMSTPAYAAHISNVPAHPVSYSPEPQHQTPADQSWLPSKDQSMLDLFPHDIEFVDMSSLSLDFFDLSSVGNGTGGPAGILDNLGFSM